MSVQKHVESSIAIVGTEGYSFMEMRGAFKVRTFCSSSTRESHAVLGFLCRVKIRSK